jgi:hypothetical protein
MPKKKKNTIEEDELNVNQIEIDISKIKPNPSNPRIIKDDRFEKLVKSIKDFPKMMELRPIIVDSNNMILGGNMRLKALNYLSYKKIPKSWIKQASDLTDKEKEQFIIKDNVGFGDWDWDMLANEWNSEELEAWGLDVPAFSPEIDYDILNDDDVSSQLEDMQNGVKKAIQIEFEAKHYDEAYQLVKFWREKEAYVGGMIMEYLKSEKDKL